ncbi:MAG: hypothetical protein AAF630_19900 [Cyanobacteria bacterium P01_C01_bin.38]
MKNLFCSKFLITNPQLPIPNYQLPTTNYQLPTTKLLNFVPSLCYDLT